MPSLAADAAFDRHLKQPLLRVVIDQVRRRCRKLLRLKEAVDMSSFNGQHDLGLQVVPIERIIGTLGRASDFDNDFRPRRSTARRRWISIYQAQYDGVGLPAVELYKVGDSYFVEDGHHRVSVAHANGQMYIDAHVIEIEAVPDLRPACDR